MLFKYMMLIGIVGFTMSIILVALSFQHSKENCNEEFHATNLYGANIYCPDNTTIQMIDAPIPGVICKCQHHLDGGTNAN